MSKQIKSSLVNLSFMVPAKFEDEIKKFVSDLLENAN